MTLIQPYIEGVTIQNIKSMKFDEMLEKIGDIALERLPEGSRGSASALANIDVALGRFANLYSYLIHLWAYLSNEAEKQALMAKDENWKMLLRKKDAVYEIAQAVKGKRESASRMLAVPDRLDQYIPDRRPQGYETLQNEHGRKAAQESKKGWGGL
jgi:hypothetical protein